MSTVSPIDPQRRALLLGAGTAMLAAKARASLPTAAPAHAVPAHAAPSANGNDAHAAAVRPLKVVTLNGCSLPYNMHNGVKVFHLIAEEIEHELAPGTRYPVPASKPGATTAARRDRR